MRRRVLLWSLAVAAGTLAILFAISIAQLRPERLRARITNALAARLNADVTIEDLEVTFLPRMRLSGSGVALRIRNRPELPPFVSIAHFRIDLGLLSATRRHVETMHVDGLMIQVPPKDARDTLGSQALDDVEASMMSTALNPSKVIIDHLITHDAQLAFVSRKPNKRPLVFLIRDLELDDLGFDRVVPFHARLTNPLPTGLVDAKGTFGPWMVRDPAETPVNGGYQFSEADLSTIEGLKGTLSSTGTFDGRLAAIRVAGKTDTPNFNLGLGGRPVQLSTDFEAVVDGTNGTTLLRKVDAKMQRTLINATGAVTNMPGPGRYSVDLNVHIGQGRIEDLLMLLSSSKTPLATGNVVVDSSVHLPPGQSSVLDRLALAGRFNLSRARFQEKIQVRVQEFSRRTQGLPRDDTPENVATNVRGRFSLAKGVMKVPALSFEVPGALVSLAGECNFKVRSLALQGTLQMQASVSKAVGGFKSIFLRVVDPFFRKKGRGTVVPIKVNGTIDAPEVGLNLRRKQ